MTMQNVCGLRNGSPSVGTNSSDGYATSFKCKAIQQCPHGRETVETSNTRNEKTTRKFDSGDFRRISRVAAG
jgi:hypothetical protein